MQDALTRQLTAVGLGEYEAEVFSALVRHSPASAAGLAKKTGYSRSTVYTALDRLIAKGLAGTTYKNEIKQFVAQPPSAVREFIRRDEESLRGRLKAYEDLEHQLSNLFRDDASIPKIMFFEGQDSLKKIYLGMLRDAPQDATMRVLRDEFVWGKEWSFVFSQDWNDKVRKLRSAKNIATRLLVNDSPEERRHAKYYAGRRALEVRVLPAKHDINHFVTYVLGDTVSILTTENGNLLGIKMTNALIARNFTKIFEALWGASKAPKRGDAKKDNKKMTPGKASPRAKAGKRPRK